MEVYLGIYIKALRKDKDSFVEERKCTQGHYTNRNHVYCPACGNKIIVERTKEDGQLNFIDIIEDYLEDWRDYFIYYESKDKKHDILIPNHLNTFGKDLYDEGEYPAGGYAGFTEFKEEYKDFIKAIEPHYKSLSYDYGVVIYYD